MRVTSHQTALGSGEPDALWRSDFAEHSFGGQPFHRHRESHCPRGLPRGSPRDEALTSAWLYSPSMLSLRDRRILPVVAILRHPVNAISSMEATFSFGFCGGEFHSSRRCPGVLPGSTPFGVRRERRPSCEISPLLTKPSPPPPPVNPKLKCPFFSKVEMSPAGGNLYFGESGKVYQG
jgi:hypothetical protein